MFRPVAAFAVFILFTVNCLAQSIADDSTTNLARQTPSIESVAHPGKHQNQSISIARLGVPRKARQVYEKAEKAILKNNYDVAQRQLDQALKLYPAFTEALTLYGVIQLALNQREAAEHSLQAAVRSDPTYGPAYIILGDLCNEEGRFDDALAMTQQAVALIPDSWRVQYEMARALLGKRQYDLALTVSDAALRTNRGTLLHLAKAHALIGLNKYSQAILELQTYLQYQPAGLGSQDARNLLREMQSRMGQ
jgi:tetratricopeptide (TPR) repeat protein